MTTQTSRVEALNSAIKAAGGIFPFARSLNVSHQVVYQWKKRGYVPTNRALVIEHLYGVPHRELIHTELVSALSQPIHNEFL